MNYMLLHPDAKCPNKKSHRDAAYDLYTPEAFDIYPGELKVIDTGFACALPEGKWSKIHERSKLAKKGLMILGGVIDNNYRGSWGVVLYNVGPTTISFDKQEAFAQFTFENIVEETFEKVDSLDETDRGNKGIWS